MTEFVSKVAGRVEVPVDRHMTVSVSSSLTISESPTDYVLGLIEVLAGVADRLRRNPMIQPSGVYVREALDDRDELRHPLSFRAERFSLRGAIYATTQLDFFALELDLDRQAIDDIANHYIAIAAECVRHKREWPERTIARANGTTWLCGPSMSHLDDIHVDCGPEQVFETLDLVSKNIDRILAEMDEHKRVLSPWQFGTRNRYDRRDWDERPRPSPDMAIQPAV